MSAVTYHADAPRKDWVAIGGVAQLPMRELIKMDADSTTGYTFALSVTQDGMFFDQAGEPVDWRNDFLALTVQQWDWWRGRIWRAAREEIIDPEA